MSERGTRRTSKSPLAALAIAALLSACGTTVPGATSAVGPGGGLAVSSDQGGPATTTPLLPPATSTGGTLSGGAGGRSSGELATGVGRGTSANPVPGPGALTASAEGGPLKVGFLIQDFRFGRQGPDPLQGFKDIVSYINAHGGFHGRRIDPDFYAEDANQGSPDSLGQQACAHFTQDHHVALVVSDEMFNPSLQACLAAAHIPDVDAGIAFNPDATAQKEAPYYMGATTIGADRYEPELLKTALSQRWVKPGEKIGVIVEGCPLYQRVYDQVVAPTARRLGLQLVPEQVDCSAGIENLGTGVAQVQSTVLKFRSAGATAVTAVSAAEEVIWAFFAPQAQQQQYYPTYLLTSDAYPYELAADRSSSLSFPAEQLSGVRGIGWIPVADLGASAAPASSAQRAQRDLCLSMSRSHGGASTKSNP